MQINRIIILLALLLSGCASMDWQELINKHKLAVAQEEADKAEAAAFKRSPWRIIKGIQTVNNAFSPLLGEDRVDLEYPVAITVSDGFFYAVDADRDHLIYFDMVTQFGRIITDLGHYAKGPIMDIYAYDDRFILLTDPEGEQVLMMDLDGNYLRTLSAPGVLRSPVGVAVNRERNEILVADGSYDHIVVFNFQGEPIATLGERGMEDGEFRSITTLAWSERDGLYVAMRAGARIQLLGKDGQFKRRLNTKEVLFPNAMAVDRRGRLYVSDLMSNNIKVYDQGELVHVWGGTGDGPGQFQRITDVWIEQDVLYVVDSLNGRIQSRVISE